MLGLEESNFYILNKHPNKNNIRYCVKQICRGEIIEHFKEVIDTLKKKKHTAERVLIYYQAKVPAQILFNNICYELGDHLYYMEKKPPNRIVEVFTADSPSSVKKHVVNEMAKSESHLRCLICTSAFGMGIDVQGVTKSIHFAPPQTLESFVQESGRIGRNGEKSTSIILSNSILQGKCDQSMREFLTTLECRRAKCMSLFPGDYTKPIRDCECCDVCYKKCSCGDCSPMYRSLTNKPSTEKERSRSVNQEQRTTLKGFLENYRISYFQQTRLVKQVSLPNMFFEFNEYHVNQVMCNVSKIFSISDVMDRVEIWRPVHARQIIQCFSKVFDDVCFDGMDMEKVEESPNIDPHWLSILNNTSQQHSLNDSDFSRICQLSENAFESSQSKRSLDDIDCDDTM
eukprot:TCONS_00035660-protein